jgi:Tol biopolymer transport system component
MKRIILIMICCLVTIIISTGQEQQAQKLLSKAIYEEEVNGNLDEAIKSYQMVLDQYPDSRKVSAEALFHLGMCYEKQGIREAVNTYQRLVSNYPDQKNLVDQAKNRLASLEKTLAKLNQKPKFRKIEIASKPKNGILSPDGKKLAFMSGGAVWTVPLQGKVDPNIAGEPKKLADIPDLWEGSGMICWSANGNWIAVYGDAEKENYVGKGTTVYTIPVNGDKLKRVNLPAQGGHLWSYRLSLSPDGQELAFSAVALGESIEEANEKYIFKTPVSKEQPEQISPIVGWLPSYSPDGKYIAYSAKADIWIVPASGGKPHKLTSINDKGKLRGPVWSPDMKYIAANYEGPDNNISNEIRIYPISTNAKQAGQPVSIELLSSSLSLIAGWTLKNELGVFMKPEANHALYSVPASGGKAMQMTSDKYYPFYPRWSPDGKQIYFKALNYETENLQSLYVPASGGSPLPLIKDQEKTAARVPGGGYYLSPDGEYILVSQEHGIFKIPLNGSKPVHLTQNNTENFYPCWSPDGKQVAFLSWHSDSDNQSYCSISLVPAEGGNEKLIAGKEYNIHKGSIAYSPDGRKIAFFSDGKIKTVATDSENEVQTLVEEVQSNEWSQLAFSPDGSKLAYTWGKVWITSLKTGKKEQLETGLPGKIIITDFDWSPNGERIVFKGISGGEPEFWLISDFLSSNMK